MKCPVLYGLVFCTVLSSTAFAQEFEVPITISDNTNSAVLTIGVHPNGTDGFDAGLDAFAPPPPPAGAFDVRSIIGVEAFITDIRDIATVEEIFHLQYQPASGQGSIVLTWDSTGLSMLGSFFITDDVTGDLFGPLDMTTTDRLEVSTAGGLLDDRLRVLVTPSLPQENSAPTALDDTATTDEDTALDIDVLANDTDPDGDALAVTQVSDPPNGTASITPGGMVFYQPDADFHGTDSFTYTISDPGGLTAQATVTVTVTPVNDVPTFTNTPVTEATPGESYSYAIAAADVDDDALTLTAPTLPTWLEFTDNGDGTATLEGTPSPTDAGTHDVLLEATDSAVTVQQDFTVTVSAAMNLPPSAMSPTTPLNGAMVRLEGDPGAAFIVEWNAANDPNGDVVSYRWELSLTQTFSTLLFNEDVGMAIRFEMTVGAVATALTRAGIPVGSALKVFHRVVT